MIEVTPESYIIDGRKFDRVSWLIKQGGLLPDYNSNGNALEFGTNVHLTCEYFDRGILKESTLDPALKPYLEQWKAFMQSRAKWNYIEHTVVSKIYGYAGTLDRSYNDCIFDIKTGSPAKWHGVQLALYKIAFEEQEHIKIHSMYCVYLTADNYKLIKYNKKQDMSAALALLTLKNYKEG